MQNISRKKPEVHALLVAVMSRTVDGCSKLVKAAVACIPRLGRLVEEAARAEPEARANELA
jgi:hypothetical protein